MHMNNTLICISYITCTLHMNNTLICISYITCTLHMNNTLICISYITCTFITHSQTFLTECAAVTLLVMGELSSSLATLSYNRTLLLYASCLCRNSFNCLHRTFTFSCYYYALTFFAMLKNIVLIN